ncbi:MAG: GNAT family N-acyltransferase [Flavobacteriales bacterium]
MPTLRHITTHAEVLEYHRFRYAIYANSPQSGFLAGAVGFDMDEFDATAIHFGWYEAEKLIGCVRLLTPIESAYPLHLFKDLIDEDQTILAHDLLKRTSGEPPLCEVSRLCLAPEHRSPASVHEFVLQIIANAKPVGRDHFVFTCDRSHVPFWLKLGFTMVDGFKGYKRQRSENDGYLMEARYADLLRVNKVALQALSLVAITTLAVAA